jgi:heme oxygenase
MNASGSSTTGRLKAATESLHRQAETGELQRRLVKGEVDRDLCVAYLQQLLIVHAALEGRIRAAAAAHGAFVTVLRDHHWRASLLREDLARLGAGTDTAEPLAATSRLLREIEEIATGRPVALLGMLYVLEGSTNGSRFIAAAMRRRLGLSSGEGLCSLDPHRELQGVRWLAFKNDMDAAGFAEGEVAALVEAAQTMFRAFIEVGDQLLEPVAA